MDVTHAAVSVPMMNGFSVIIATCEMASFLVTGNAFEYPPSELDDGDPDCMACIAGTG